jgi:hypothetical protein
VARARRDLALPDTESFARDTLKKIRGLLATDGRASLEAVARDARARGAVMLARVAEKALANRGKL